MMEHSSNQQGRGRGRYGQRREADRLTGRELPSSPEAESHVLGCVLLDGGDSLQRAIRAGITVASFVMLQNQVVWGACVGLNERGLAPAVDTVTQVLMDERKLEAAGGVQQLMELERSAPTTARLGFFLEVLREKELLRRLVLKANEVAEAAYTYTGGGLEAFEAITRPIADMEELKSRGGRQLPSILTGPQFVGDKQSALPDEIVKGVLHKGAKMMVAGGSKSFKTWVLLDLGLSVATGTPWWGMATVPGRVLYVNLELMREFCEQRVRRIMEAKHMKELTTFDSWHLRGYARDFKELLPHVLAAMGGSKYSLIILDPVYKILGERDENANGEVAQLLNEFEALAVRTGAAVAYGHHHSKGNQSEKDARDRSSGAGAWTRDPDALVDLTPHEEDEHFVATFTLRNHAAKPPMVVEWKFPCMSIAPGMDPAALKGPGRKPKWEVADAIVPLVGRAGGMSYSDLERAARGKGISESSFKRLLARAEESGRVRKVMGVYVLEAKEKAA